MPSLQIPSYAGILIQQLEPQAKSSLDKLIKKSEEELEKPDSPERKKIINELVSIMAIIQFEKQLTNQINEIIYQIKERAEIDAKDAQARSSHSHTHSERKEQGKDPIEKMLQEASDSLKKIYGQMAQLQTSYQINMKALNTSANTAVNNILQNTTAVTLTASQIQQLTPAINNLYQTRASQKLQLMANLTHVATPQMTSEPATKNVDPEMEKARSEQIERLKGILEDKNRLGNNYGMITQIQLVGVLGDLIGSNPKVVTHMAKEIHGTADGFANLMQDLTESHEKTIENLREKARELNQIALIKEGKGKSSLFDKAGILNKTSTAKASNNNTPTPMSTIPKPPGF